MDINEYKEFFLGHFYKWSLLVDQLELFVQECLRLEIAHQQSPQQTNLFIKSKKIQTQQFDKLRQMIDKWGQTISNAEQTADE